MRRAGAGAAVLALTLGAGCVGPPPHVLTYGDLDGWAQADHGAVAEVLAAQCAATDLALPCPPERAGRAFWEAAFEPVLLPGADAALLTGYFEPVLPASPVRTARFHVPLHGLPAGAGEGPGPTRDAIANGALEGRAAVLYWLDDPVEAFFLHIQGSGRLRLPDGREVRVGYAGRNGHPYTSIGRVLVERGEMAVEDVTAESLRAWLRADPARGRALMNENASYIYFREVSTLAPGEGPVGALGLALTPGISAALDPTVYPPGSPVWIAADGPDGPIRRLALAQDTGSAIRGPGRADLFIGTGAEAGRIAGRLSAPARIVLLRPRGAAEPAS